MTAIWQHVGLPFVTSKKIDVPGNNNGVFGQTFSVERLPSEPIGDHTLTLENVVVGSRIAIRDQAGTTTLFDDVAATSTVTVTLPVNGSGSPLNDWRIKVRKASAAPFYQPYETLMTASVGSSSIYVSQIPDE